jgi:L-rhamnose mutarotase
MKTAFFAGLAVAATLCAVALFARSESSHLQRVGMVIGIKPDQISAYEALHDASNFGVRDLLEKYHMHNFSIYMRQLDDGKYYLFGYYEYTGNDYRADMEKLGAEPRNQKWLSVTDPMQIPLAGEKSWGMMKEVYHNP